MLLYGENTTTFGEYVVIVAHQIANDQAVKIKAFIGWGDAAGEFEIWVNNEFRAGCRTSDEKRTEQVWFGDGLICNSEDEITVLGTHYTSGVRKLQCNLELMRIA